MTNAHFFTFLCLAIFGSQIEAFEFWNDLRVTWGPADKPSAAYNRLPRNTVDAAKDGWQKVSTTCENGGQFSGYQWIDPKDDGVALLFDTRGFVAGMHLMVPQSELLVPGNKINYSKVPVYSNYTLNGKSYFVVTTYFINPSLICTATGKPTGNLGAESMVYFQNGPTINDLKVAPKNRADAISQGWTSVNCYPGMGWHNFYGYDKYQESDCTESQPTCILYNELGQMHGFCLMFAGTAKSTRFEAGGNSASVQGALGPTAKCFLDEADQIGATTIHVFFHNTPWLVGC